MEIKAPLPRHSYAPTQEPVGNKESAVLRSPFRQPGLTSLSPPMPLGEFTGRVLIILLLAAAAVVVWQALSVLLLLFGAVLLVVGLRAAARLVARLPAVGAGSLLFLAVLGMVGAKAGGASILKPTIGVMFWGALAMALTTGIGTAIGKAV